MATLDETRDHIEALAVHCRPPLMDVEARARWIQDWCEDLKHYTDEQIRDAAAKWRREGNGKFPSPAQLIGLIRSAMPSNGSGYKPKASNKGYSHPTDAEYRDMTVREKIESHVIKAHELKGQAGPMYSQTLNRHLAKSEMPEGWHKLQSEAQFHLDRASELRKYLKQSA